MKKLIAMPVLQINIYNLTLNKTSDISWEIYGLALAKNQPLLLKYITSHVKDCK